jgi:peptidoglycan-associated lipoprotein
MGRGVRHRRTRTQTASVVALLAVLLIAALAGCGGKDTVPGDVAGQQPAGTQPAAGSERDTPPPPPPPSSTTGEAREPGSESGASPAVTPLPELEDVHFEFDRYNLTTEARSILAEDARALEAAPTVPVVIEGHCDERGTIEYNLALGEKRASAVKEYLVQYGLDDSRLRTVSYGEERPLDPAATEEAWAKNRRAHLRPVR